MSGALAPAHPSAPRRDRAAALARAAEILAVTLRAELGRQPPVRAVEALAALVVCRRAAARAVAGTLPDPTGGATHWHAGEALPPWALGLIPVAELGGLAFYRTPAS